MQPTNHREAAINAGFRAMYGRKQVKSVMRTEPIVKVSEDIGRNDPCPCGSGKKFKHCHLKGT